MIKSLSTIYNRIIFKGDVWSEYFQKNGINQ